ncbi:MAG: TIGR01244 family sulfur transferase [Alphaproteobacteria bacterium]
MDSKQLTPTLHVSQQLKLSDLKLAKEAGFYTIINNRPDGEVPRQPRSETLEKRAKELGLAYYYLPVTPGQFTDQGAKDFAEILHKSKGKALAFCRTGTRSATLWAKSQSGTQKAEDLINIGKAAGYDLSGLRDELEQAEASQMAQGESRNAGKQSHQIVIIGGGSAGIAAAASLLRRSPKLDIAIIDPAEEHFYQPGWTMVGGGIFTPEKTRRKMKGLIPSGVKWIKVSAAIFSPDRNEVTLANGQVIGYEMLIVAPGLQLDFNKIEGLKQTLGQNGVTSNYRYDLAPYTWKLVQELKSGTAIFTQPPMPIKCAGAPQKAMYLSADHWRHTGVLNRINVKFCNTGGVIFGVAAFVPALMKYVKRYNINLNFGEQLVKVDGPNKTAWFEKTDADGNKTRVERKFDMLHVVPPQSAPDFIKSSPLVNEAGWVDVDQYTLQHNKHPNIYSLGDASSTPNAKTMAAARKQAPIVAANITAQMSGSNHRAAYDGYGACPLTVERGKVVLAEFGYGGTLLPSLPTWLVNGTKATRAAWFLKDSLLPNVYWNQMLKGKEFLAKPDVK